MFLSKLFQGPPITPLRPLWLSGPQFIKPWSMWFSLDFYSCILTNLSFKNRTDLTEWYYRIAFRAIILIFNIYAAEKIPWYYAITNVFLSSESQKRPLLFQLCLRSAGLRSGVLPPAGAAALTSHPSFMFPGPWSIRPPLSWLFSHTI